MSTQRFGFEGGGAGREGRHDVIFFERNGLRHGEFSLKIDQLSVKEKRPDDGRDRKWGYRVRELAWNSDSTVLAIWVEGNDGDVGKVSLNSPKPLLNVFSSILDYGKLPLVWSFTLF
jgi:elongator complex protein 1